MPVVMFPEVMGTFEELDSEGSFLELRAYYVLKVEIMQTLIILEMSVSVYMCMNLEVTYFWASTHQLFKPGSSLANRVSNFFCLLFSVRQFCSYVVGDDATVHLGRKMPLYMTLSRGSLCRE